MSKDYTTKQPYIIQISYIILRFSEVKTLIIMNVMTRLLSIEDSPKESYLKEIPLGRDLWKDIPSG